MKTLQEAGLHHVGFVVKDADAVLKEFAELYGLTVGKAYEFRPTRAWSYGKEVEDYLLKIAMITMDDGSTIEIIEPISGEGVHKDFVQGGGNGMHHLCFCVDDYDYWRNYFAEKNATIVFESETEDDLNGYRRCFYAEDRLVGMVYEIKEKPYFRK